MPIKYRNIVAGMLLSLSALPALGSTPLSPGADSFYVRAFEMYDLNNYTGAIDQITRFLEVQPQAAAQSSEPRMQAALLLLKASTMRGDFERADRLYATLQREAAGRPLLAQATVAYADALFFQGKYAEAISEYEAVNMDAIPSAEQADARYRYAVALIHRGFYERAMQQLEQLAQWPQYANQAAFYGAYIDYLQYKYADALQAFRALPPEVAEQFGADYYIAQILFAGGRYDEVLRMKQPLLAAAAVVNTPASPATAEAYRMIGESEYAVGSKKSASDYLKRYQQMMGEGSARSALYLLGVMSYEAGDTAQTRAALTAVAEGDDNLAQSALLYLGQAAMRERDFDSAAMLFDSAARMTADMNVAETALYNYAAATTSGGRVPFGSTSELLEEFGRRFPNSKYAADVDNYLALGYMSERRYDKALQRLERIRKPSADVRKAMQICLYELGCSALADKDYGQAEVYLTRAVALQADPAVTAQANLWLGDALYGAGKDKAAVEAYKKYLNQASKTDTNRGLALYNQAYASMRAGDYAQAKQQFADALRVSGTGQLSDALARDAKLRQADCDNYAGNIAGALAQYESAAAEGAADADYAAFQAACMQGVAGNQARKAADLEAMLSRWPASEWASAALYELVQAHIAGGDLKGAESARERLAKLRPDSEQLRESAVAIAGAYSNAGQPDAAIAECREIITLWPSSKQARTASEYLQSLYSRKGMMSEYLSFIGSVPGAPRPSADDMDRLSYFAAVEALEDAADTGPMQEYLRLFPAGAYAADASLALAQVYAEAGNTGAAEDLLNNIITRYPDSDSAPEAMLMQAEIIGKNGQSKEATALYEQVLRKAGAAYTPRAYMGLIKLTTDPKKRLDYIERFLSLPALDEASVSEVEMLKARTLADAGDYAAAEAMLKPLASNSYSAEGAQATIALADIYLKQKKNTQAIELLNAFTASGCEDSHWLARGYIALADAYAASGYKSKARSYIKALQDNYTEPDTEIHNLIRDRLSKY